MPVLKLYGGRLDWWDADSHGSRGSERPLALPLYFAFRWVAPAHSAKCWDDLEPPQRLESRVLVGVQQIRLCILPMAWWESLRSCCCLRDCTETGDIRGR